MSPYRSTSSYAAGYATAPSAPAVFSLADLTAILSERRGLIFKVMFLVVALAALVALLLPVQYTSSVAVMLDQRKNNITDLSAVLSQLPTDPATLQNQIQVITSRGLAEQVITGLRLYEDSEFNPLLAQDGWSLLANPARWFSGDVQGDSASAHDRIMATFLKHVTAEANGLSTVITISVTSKDPRKAQRIADALADAYVAGQVDIRRNANRGTSDWLDKRTNDLAQQLMLEQQAVEEYKARHGLNDSAPGNSLVDQQMAAINAQIVAAKSDLAEKQAAADRVDNAGGNPDNVSQVVASPVIVQLRGQQADLLRQDADLSSKYGPLHPKLQSVQAQERDLAAKISQEVTRIAGSLDNDVTTAKAHLNSLQQSLNDVERQANGQNMARVELQALQSNADSTKTQYETFVGRLRATDGQDAVTTPESQIISPASLPLSPSAPKRWLIVAASLPLGALLGILAALLAERFGTAVPVRVQPYAEPRATIIRPAAAARPRRTKPAPGPVTKALPAPWNGPPILAELANAEKLGAAAYVVDYPASRYAQTMAALIGQLDSHDQGAAVVAVTAVAPGESKSAVAVSIARAAAQMGRKTVLIDCDPGQMAMKAMRAPSQAGLYEVLTGSAPLAQALAKDSQSGAYALAMTRRPPSLATMFNSAAMGRLIQVLKEGADLVVMDCSRAAAPEAAMLARLSDATLLVARKDSLRKASLAKSVEMLAGAHAAPLGIIATT